jgi:mRNA interferase MazF
LSSPNPSTPQRGEIWLVNFDPINGLTKVSAVDALQLRGMDRQRFIRKLGDVAQATMEAIVLAIAAIVEYP